MLLKKYIIREDAVEALFIIILLLIAYILSNIYKKEMKKYREQTRRLIRDNCDLDRDDFRSLLPLDTLAELLSAPNAR